MKVSVILPIYNGEKTLVETLRSLTFQTFQNFELVACIDGTEDGSEYILESYREHFLKLTILKNKKNLGLGPTMNRLVANSQGEYIAIAEQDDYYYKDRLMLEVECLDNDSDVGMVSGIADFYNGKEITGRFPGILDQGNQYPKGNEMFLLNYRNQVKVVNSCLMIRKSVHIDNGLYFTKHYPNVGIDWTYVLRFSMVSEIRGLPNVLVRIDRSTNNKSITTHKKIMFKASRELIRLMLYEYPNIITSRDYRFALRSQILLELRQNYGVKFYIKALVLSLRYLKDKRFRFAISERLKQRFNHKN